MASHNAALPKPRKPGASPGVEMSISRSVPGSLDHWLTERYCLYTAVKHSVYRAEIHHQPWPLQDATAEFSTNTMASAAGIQLPAIQPLLHFAKRLEVLIWPLKRA